MLYSSTKSIKKSYNGSVSMSSLNLSIDHLFRKVSFPDD